MENKQHLLICNGYGSLSAYGATVENAMKIFNENISNLREDVRSIADNQEKYFIDNFTVSQILLEVLTVPVGGNLPKLQKLVNQESFPNTQAYINEVALFMVSNSIAKEKLNGMYGVSLEKAQPIEKLALFAGVREKAGKPIGYVTYKDDFDTAARYKVIKNGQWKDGVAEYKIANHIIEFVNQNLVDTSDIKYEVITYQEKY